MPEQSEWEKQAANLLKSELKRKLSRGKFSAAFMLACLKAIDQSQLNL